MVNLALGVCSWGALAAPGWLAALGWSTAADGLYAAYHLTCHQWAFRSFFLFGQQAVYSEQQLADLGLDPFRFVGGQGLGWKMAFCERDLAIYLGLLLVGMLYARRRDLRPGGFGVYGVLILPMAVDGFTQLFGWRESTWELRVVTGLAVRTGERLACAASAGHRFRTRAGRQTVCSGRRMRTTVDRSASRVSVTPELIAWVRGLISLAFVLLLPLLVISTSLRGLVTDRDLMLRGFRDNQVATTTGLDDTQLARIADAFVAYFQGPPGQIQMQVTAFGQPRALFNDREVTHMEDVQALIQWFLRMQFVAAAVVVVRLAAVVVFDRSPAPIGREMLWSTGLMVALVVLVGVLSLMDFEGLWTRFHQIAFRNDLWQLDPTTDYLIMLFPEPFWFTATIRMATTVALQTVLLAAVGVALIFSQRFLGDRPS